MVSIVRAMTAANDHTCVMVPWALTVMPMRWMQSRSVWVEGVNVLHAPVPRGANGGRQLFAGALDPPGQEGPAQKAGGGDAMSARVASIARVTVPPRCWARKARN